WYAGASRLIFPPQEEHGAALLHPLQWCVMAFSSSCVARSVAFMSAAHSDSACSAKSIGLVFLGGISDGRHSKAPAVSGEGAQRSVRPYFAHGLRSPASTRMRIARS